MTQQNSISHNLAIEGHEQKLSGHRNNCEIVTAIITKNEEIDLPICLSSICDQVDYIVIGDTGSTDRTKDVILDWCNSNNWTIIKEGETFAFPLSIERKTLILFDNYEGSEKTESGYKLWDFSCARNRVLDIAEKTSAGWMLSMDSDDRLMNDKNLKELIKNISDYTAISFKCVASDKKNQDYTHQLRLWKISDEKKVRYADACHEYVVIPESFTHIHEDINVVHTYTQYSSQESGHKRNIRILEAEYNKGNKTPRILSGYIRALGKDDDKKVVDICKEYISMKHTHLEGMFVRLFLIKALVRLGRYKEAIKTALEAVSKDERFSEIWCELAYLYEVQQEYMQAIGMAYCAMREVYQTGLFTRSASYNYTPNAIASRCFEKIGNIDMALYHNAKCLEMYPNYDKLLAKQNELVNKKIKSMEVIKKSL